jgi:hypothetical protein
VSDGEPPALTPAMAFAALVGHGVEFVLVAVLRDPAASRTSA